MSQAFVPKLRCHDSSTLFINMSCNSDDNNRSGLYRAKVSDFVSHFFVASPKYKKHKSEEIFEKYQNKNDLRSF